MHFTTRRREHAVAAPRIGCSTCGLRISLERVVRLGDVRVLACERCHQVDVWQVGSSSSLQKGLDLLDEGCRSLVEEISRHRL